MVLHEGEDVAFDTALYGRVGEGIGAGLVAWPVSLAVGWRRVLLWILRRDMHVEIYMNSA